MAETPRRFPVLETERLVLDEITMEHDEWYFRHFSRPEIVEGQGFSAPESIEKAREELELYIVNLFRKGQGFRWGIRLKGGHEYVGSAGYYNWDKDSRRAHIGYDLQPQFWRQGIMTEALERIVRYGFEEMKLNRIGVTIMATNLRSSGLVEKLGFQREGAMREYSQWNGIFVDEFIYSMLKSDWMSRR